MMVAWVWENMDEKMLLKEYNVPVRQDKQVLDMYSIARSLQ
jgi:hypothetical protein